MDDGDSSSGEPKSDLERAIRNFIKVLSNAQLEMGSETGATAVQCHPPACRQTTSENTHRGEQSGRSFSAVFQRRQKRRKWRYPAKFGVPAARRIRLSFCLLPASTTKTHKDELKLLPAGLARRTVCIADDADHEEITRVLHEKYPKMKTLSGGWLLYKAAGGKGQRNLSVVAQGTQGYTSKMLKMATSNGRHRLYIVPLHEEMDSSPLPLDAAESSQMPKSICISCGLNMPLQILVGHTESCGQRKTEATKFDGNTSVPCSS